MKARSRDKHSDERWREQSRQLVEKEYRRHVLTFSLTLLALILIQAIYVGLTAGQIGRFPFFLLILPFAIRYCLLEFQFLKDDRRLVKLYRLKHDVYADWMMLRSSGERDAGDLARAIDLWNEYRDQYQQKHRELVSLLQDTLKRKTERMITVSVMAGLVFLSGKKEDQALLRRARHRCGAAGHMIPDCWIQTLGLPSPEFQEEHQRQSGEFRSYWDEKRNEAMKTSS